jgi:3-methyladenine DNA glycosylase AlkC
MDAILRTNGPFQIVYYGDRTFEVALQISRNLYQYFFADSFVLNFKLLVTAACVANDATGK